jgi:hypothetical protein
MFDYLPSEEFFPWLGPGFHSSDSSIYDAELFHVPSLEEIITCWGLADAYESGPSAQPVMAHFNQSTDPDSKPFVPTDIRLAGPVGYPMLDIGCSNSKSCEPFYPSDPVSNLE